MNTTNSYGKAAKASVLAVAMVMLVACGQKPSTEAETNLPPAGSESSSVPAMTAPTTPDSMSAPASEIAPSDSGSSSSTPTGATSSPTSLIEKAPARHFEGTQFALNSL